MTPPPTAHPPRATAPPLGLGALALCLAALALAGCGASPLEPAASARAPEPVASVSLAGDPVTVPTPNRVNVVSFWATWCEPCLREMPQLEALWRSYRSAGVRVVGVAADDNPGKVARVAHERRVTYPMVLDVARESSLQGRYRVTELPRTVVLDGEGRVRFSVGAAPDAIERVEEAVRALLAED